MSGFCPCGDDEPTALDKAEAKRLEELQRIHIDSQAAIKAGSTVLSTDEARQIVRRERLSRRYFGLSFAELKASLADVFNSWGKDK